MGKAAVWSHFIAHTHKFLSCLQLLSLSQKAQQVIFYAGTNARDFVWKLREESVQEEGFQEEQIP